MSEGDELVWTTERGRDRGRYHVEQDCYALQGNTHGVEEVPRDELGEEAEACQRCSGTAQPSFISEIGQAALDADPEAFGGRSA